MTTKRVRQTVLCSGRTGFRIPIAVVLAFGAMGDVALADGYHDAALAAASLEAWEQQVARTLGLQRIAGGKGASGEMVAGTDLSRLRASGAATPYQRLKKEFGPAERAQVDRLAGVLAWMDRSNIIPREFPNFKHERIPHFREAAKNMLAAMGPDALGRLVQDLATPPPAGQGMTLAPTFAADILDTLGRMGRLNPERRFSAAGAEQWLRSISRCKLVASRKSAAVRTLFSLLATSELKKLKVSSGWEAIRQSELMERLVRGEGGALSGPELTRRLAKIIVGNPDSFIDLRARYPGKAAEFDAALRKASATALKRAYRKTGSLGAVRLLLEKPGGIDLLTDADWADPKLQELLSGVLDSPDVSPASAAAALRQRSLTVGELKRLVSSTKRGEKIGAYWLLLESSPRTTSDAKWLFKRLTDETLSDVVHEFSDKLVDRVAEAPSESLVALLTLGNADVSRAVASELLERVRSPSERTKIVAVQGKLIGVFREDMSGQVGLIRLLAALKTKASFGALVDGLTDPDARVWQACRNELTFIYRAGIRYGPPDRADVATREEAQGKWRKWLGQYQEPG